LTDSPKNSLSDGRPAVWPFLIGKNKRKRFKTDTQKNQKGPGAKISEFNKLVILQWRTSPPGDC
jgi:hypothetical protein